MPGRLGESLNPPDREYFARNCHTRQVHLIGCADFPRRREQPVTIPIHYIIIKVGYAMHAQEIEHLIEEQLPGARATVRGDDGVHFDAVVVSDRFAGKSLIQQHRLVYAALGGRMEREEIHALSLKTYTPDAWRERQTQPAETLS
jgi:acid stress-induced BolA-like protein IbaG/YrbA